MLNRKRPLEPQPRAIVIGASSGIGAALTRKLVAEGYIVAALARRVEKLEMVCATANGAGPGHAIPYEHNVTDYETIPALFQSITRDLGGLDVIAYVAGMQPPVALNEYNFEKDEAMVKVNMLGAIAWLNEAAMRFERAEAGHILGVSSIAGDRGRVGSPVYNASKAGLNTYLEALRNRLSRHGVTVTTIKPGFVDTVLLENAPKTFWVVSTDEAAAQIYRALRWKLQTVYVPLRWALVGLVLHHIPSFVFRRLSF
ncbi:MAG: SDR family NAD(P)-dependent oxidoreductase [Ardenticatenaceae bacterium]|nr:SDR family NAD(P)-dependent oxidoreductase [Anaerolineales bacterium]MCB8922742.1 SDR family NAD(P)-dependent oxidoreductase [Ardenticatenaceae bacterium]MCB9003553.1 SDR family NAD(P)-dependent oxidoreductase [Ardenticatenaceae bacterium]